VCSSPEEAAAEAAAVEAAAEEVAAVEAAAASGGAPASEAASGLGAVLAASDAQAAAEVAVCRGEVATTARPDHFPIASKAAAPAIFSHAVAVDHVVSQLKELGGVAPAAGRQNGAGGQC
jgi:hypothetical protein